MRNIRESHEKKSCADPALKAAVELSIQGFNFMDF